MCLGNRAEASSHYINTQLGALYENAIRCTEKHGTGLKPTESAVEYGTCLYEYYGPGKHGAQKSRNDLQFFAKFGRPHLDFVCNHEVILSLDIQEGHFSLDYQKKNRHHHKHEHETIKSCKIAFRIEYHTHAIENFHCQAIENAESYTTAMHVLKLDAAEFVPEHSELSWKVSSSDGKNELKTAALMHYLTKYYLTTLKRAGHHVLYSLPDFDNLRVTDAHIDYSVINQRSLTTDTLYGIHIEEVNTYLRGLWLQAASHIDEYGLEEQTVKKSFLAELRTQGLAEDLFLHLQFGPLYVQPLCKREVILYVDVQDILVHMGGYHVEHTHQLSGWKIALIVDISYEEIKESGTRRLILDLSHVRYCEHLSIFGEFHDLELLVRIKRTLIETITTYYVELLKVSETTVIFYDDLSIHGWGGGGVGEEEETEEWLEYEECTCEDEASCGHVGIRWGVINRRLITHTHTQEFDFVSALTQGGINAHFKSLWEVAQRQFKKTSNFKTWGSVDFEEEVCLADYSFVHPDHGDEIFFASSFAAPKVQLRCKEGSYSVIFYVHLLEGYLKTLGYGKTMKPGSQVHPFSQWHLAFEVDLKLVETLSENVSESIRGRTCYFEVDVVKQLVLDFSTAKFNPTLSKIHGLTDGLDFRAIRARREALVYYVQRCYFKVLERASHDVLYTIPMINRGIHRLSSFKFQIVPFAHGYSRLPLEGIYGPHSSLFARNSIVIVGMLGDREISENYWLSRDINWVGGFRQDVPHGAVCLSHRVFLEGILLKKLEKINRQTTIIPTFTGVQDGEFILELSTWEAHPMKQAASRRNRCEWTKIKSGGESLEYVWMNKEQWRYDHEGDFDGVGSYTVSCVTRNHLSLPTIRREPFTIALKGTMTLSLSYQGSEKDIHWASSTVASWGAHIVFNSDSNGLRIHVSPPHVSTSFSPYEHVSIAQENAFRRVKEEFPSVLDFGDLLSELKTSFEGAWPGSHLRAHELRVAHPVFTHHGDFLLELLPRGEQATRAVETKKGAKQIQVNGSNGTSKKGYSFQDAFHKVGDAVGYAIGSPHVHAEANSMSRTVSSASEVSISSASSYFSESSSTSINTVKHEESVSAFAAKDNGYSHVEATSINSSQLTADELVEEL